MKIISTAKTKQIITDENTTVLKLKRHSKTNWALRKGKTEIIWFYRHEHEKEFYCTNLRLRNKNLNTLIQYAKDSYERFLKDNNPDAKVVISNLEDYLSKEATHKVVCFENGRFGVEELRTGALKCGGMTQEQAEIECSHRGKYAREIDSVYI